MLIQHKSITYELRYCREIIFIDCLKIYINIKYLRVVSKCDIIYGTYNHTTFICIIFVLMNHIMKWKQ